MPSFSSRLKHAYNTFMGADENDQIRRFDYGQSYSVRQDRVRTSFTNDRSIVTSIYNRIAIDIAAVDIQHVKVDENDNFLEEVDSELNNCLKVEANLDQAATAFRMDIAMTLFEKGYLAIVPVDTTIKPTTPGAYDVVTMRVAEITQWFPQHVEVNLYNERTGMKQLMKFEKRKVAIVENPFYSVMNEPNSILQRLIRKLNLLDAIDEQAGSGKLDIIIQLPYALRTESRKQAAETRRKDMEEQLSGSKYGIAYADSTEKITQLNRPAENNMLAQVEYLTEMLYSQLGITKEVFNGTASDQIMVNYFNRTVEPILTAISEAMKRSFLTRTARTQHHSIMFFRNPFKLMSIANLAEVVDKLTRNEVLTSNEVRAIMGYKPVANDRANELVNKNMPTAPASLDAGELVPVPDQPEITRI